MANSQLIQGAADSASNFVDIGKAFEEGRLESGAGDALAKRLEEDRRNSIEMKNYVNSLEQIDVAKVEESMRPEVNDFLIKSRNEYADAARKASKLDAADPGYMEAVATMNRVNGSFKNLSTQLDGFKLKRDQYMTDTKNNSISNASKGIEKLNALYKNNDFDIVIGPNGDFTIANGGEYVPFTDFDKDTDYNYSLKNYAFTDQIMGLMEKANTFANPIIGDKGAYSRFDYQLSSFFRDMSSEDLASVVEDDLLGGGRALSETKEFLDYEMETDLDLMLPENQDKLILWVQDWYMKSLNTTALSAKKSKENDYRRELVNKFNDKYKGVDLMVDYSKDASEKELIDLRNYVIAQSKLRLVADPLDALDGP